MHTVGRRLLLEGDKGQKELYGIAHISFLKSLPPRLACSGDTGSPNRWSSKVQQDDLWPCRNAVSRRTNSITIHLVWVCVCVCTFKFFKIDFYLCVYVFLCVGMVPCACLVPTGARGEHQIHRNWSFRWLSTAVWVVGTDPMSSVGASSSFNHWGLSGPHSMFVIVCKYCTWHTGIMGSQMQYFL